MNSEYRLTRATLTRAPPHAHAPAFKNIVSKRRLFEDEQRIGRIRFAGERIPGVWLWNVTIHLTGGLPMGSARDLKTAKAEFKAAWEALKARTRQNSARRPTRQ